MSVGLITKNNFSEYLSPSAVSYTGGKKMKEGRPCKFQPPKAGSQIQTQTNPRRICCGQTGTDTGFPLSNLNFPSCFHSTNDPYLFSQLPRLYINLSIDAFVK